jgi:hypothetical protein
MHGDMLLNTVVLRLNLADVEPWLGEANAYLSDVCSDLANPKTLFAVSQQKLSDTAERFCHRTTNLNGIL